MAANRGGGVSVRIAVITPSLPTRAAMLAECTAAVSAQTQQPVAHLIGIDHARAGTSAIRNILVSAASRAYFAAYVALVDDDDLIHPNHLATLAAPAEHGADIVYSYCDVHGRDWNPNAPFDAERLRHENYIPTTVLIRGSLLERLSGWMSSAAVPHGWEDWDLWKRALDLGATFACVPEITWTYRFHLGNKTIRGEQGAL